MEVLDLTNETIKVNSFYNNSIEKLNKRKEKNKNEKERYQRKLKKINEMIESKNEQIKEIEEDENNHYNKKKEFLLIYEKEKEVDKLKNDVEDLINERDICEKGYKEIEELINIQNEEYSNQIIKFEKEKEEITKSIRNQIYYDNVLIRVSEVIDERIQNEIMDRIVNS